MQVATAAINFLLGFCAVNGSYVSNSSPHCFLSASGGTRHLQCRMNNTTTHPVFSDPDFSGVEVSKDVVGKWPLGTAGRQWCCQVICFIEEDRHPVVLLVVQVMTLIPKTQALQRVLVHLFRINPSFLLGEALIEMTRFYFLSSISEAANASDAATPASKSTSPLGDIIAGLQALTNTTATASPPPPPAG